MRVISRMAGIRKWHRATKGREREGADVRRVQLEVLRPINQSEYQACRTNTIWDIYTEAEKKNPAEAGW